MFSFHFLRSPVGQSGTVWQCCVVVIPVGGVKKLLKLRNLATLLSFCLIILMSLDLEFNDWVIFLLCLLQIWFFPCVSDGETRNCQSYVIQCHSWWVRFRTRPPPAFDVCLNACVLQLECKFLYNYSSILTLFFRFIVQNEHLPNSTLL